MKKDNCKDCHSKCEHAGQDREFVCIGGVSCKKTKDKFDISKVRILWDFGYCDEPRITIAYIDNDNIYFIFCSSGVASGALAIEDIEEMWRKVVLKE